MDKRPKGTAPDSPEVTGASPLMGAASIRIPRAETQSGADTKQLVLFLRISHEMVFGSPHASPAMIVCKSPVTKCGFPSAAVADRYRQSAARASTTTVTGQLLGKRFLKYP